MVVFSDCSRAHKVTSWSKEIKIPPHPQVNTDGLPKQIPRQWVPVAGGGLPRTFLKEHQLHCFDLGTVSPYYHTAVP